MATSFKDTIRNTMMGAVPTSIGSSGHINIYNNVGAIPLKTASPTANGAALLASLALSSTSGVVSGSPAGQLVFNAITSATAGASGTPGFYRVIDGATDDGTHTQIQGSAGVGSGDINFSSAIASGGTVSITALSYTEGDA